MEINKNNIYENDYVRGFSIQKGIDRSSLGYALVSIAVNFYLIWVNDSVIRSKFGHETEIVFIDFFKHVWIFWWIIYIICGFLIIQLLKNFEHKKSNQYINFTKKNCTLTTIAGFLTFGIILINPLFENGFITHGLLSSFTSLFLFFVSILLL